MNSLLSCGFHELKCFLLSLLCITFHCFLHLSLFLLGLIIWLLSPYILLRYVLQPWHVLLSERFRVIQVEPIGIGFRFPLSKKVLIFLFFSVQQNKKVREQRCSILVVQPLRGNRREDQSWKKNQNKNVFKISLFFILKTFILLFSVRM